MLTWACARKKQSDYQRLRSACISIQYGKGSRLSLWMAQGRKRQTRSAKTLLGLRWAHNCYCRFCRGLYIAWVLGTYNFNTMSRNVRKRTFGHDSDQPSHSRSLIRIFTGRILYSQGCKVSSRRQRSIWADCTDAHADSSLWTHMSEDTFLHVAAQILSWNRFYNTNLL